MSKNKITPINEEAFFESDEIIVSKTDSKGKIVYANDVFCRIAEMNTSDVLGQPHNIIRHPDMPRAVFKLLWDTIDAGKEIFAYVKNMSKSGRFYWVIAHVTPSFDQFGAVDGYHSNRRVPSRKAVEAISKLYAVLLNEEKKHSNAKNALDSSYALLERTLDEHGVTYSQFVWSIGE